MQAKKIRLLFKYTDRGFDRRYYKDITKRWGADDSVYCAVDGVEGIVMFACSKDGEPSHTVSNYEIVFN